MVEYELINPSDPYTFIAPDKEVAALVVFTISTLYGAKSKDGLEEIPVFIFGGSAEWYQGEFGRTPDEGLADRRKQVAGALESFMYGHFEDRKRYEAALKAITDLERLDQFKAEWQDGHSSLNDIGTYAHEMAKRIRGLAKEGGNVRKYAGCRGN